MEKSMVWKNFGHRRQASPTMCKFTEYDEYTRFHGHFSGFATKSFTASADLQANICLKIGLSHETLVAKPLKCP